MNIENLEKNGRKIIAEVDKDDNSLDIAVCVDGESLVTFNISVNDDGVLLRRWVGDSDSMDEFIDTSEILIDIPEKNNAEPSVVYIFEDNEECAHELFEYLVSVGKIKRDEYNFNAILHDINNLRGNEWLDIITFNEKTAKFFMHIGKEHLLGEIEPEKLVEIVTGRKADNIRANAEVQELFWKSNVDTDNLWDYSLLDYSEVVANCDYCVYVAFPDDEARLYEIPDCCLDEVKSAIKELRNRSHSLDDKIQQAESTKQPAIKRDNKEKNEIGRE